jgi:hypothetical protein
MGGAQMQIRFALPDSVFSEIPFGQDTPQFYLPGQKGNSLLTKVLGTQHCMGAAVLWAESNQKTHLLLVTSCKFQLLSKICLFLITLQSPWIFWGNRWVFSQDNGVI